jgi:hypothetical protein
MEGVRIIGIRMATGWTVASSLIFALRLRAILIELEVISGG